MSDPDGYIIEVGDARKRRSMHSRDSRAEPQPGGAGCFFGRGGGGRLSARLAEAYH